MKLPYPRKRFGQHFLHDRNVVARIIRAFAPAPDDVAVEIGPGRGALTRELVTRCRALHAIELDRDLAQALAQEFAQETRLRVHSADALTFDFQEIRPVGGKLRLIGNLPYNISTPLLFHVLDQVDAIHDMLFMLQKEVVDRLRARPGGKDYGRLSVMIQWRCRVEKMFDVAPGAFSPPPKVESSVVRLTPHAVEPVRVRDPRSFARVVQAAFAQRRKTLRNSLAAVLPREEIEQLGIDPGRRAETLTLDEFARLGDRASR